MLKNLRCFTSVELNVKHFSMHVLQLVKKKFSKELLESLLAGVRRNLLWWLEKNCMHFRTTVQTKSYEQLHKLQTFYGNKYEADLGQVLSCQKLSLCVQRLWT